MGNHWHDYGDFTLFKRKNPAVQIVGVQPEEGSRIPGIRRWPKEYLPGIFEAARVDLTLDVGQQAAEDTTRFTRI